MQKKLTRMIDEQVYEGLYRMVGARKISQFIESVIQMWSRRFRQHYEWFFPDHLFVVCLAPPAYVGCYQSSVQ